MEVADEYYTYDGRLASFQAAHKKRASNANGSRTTKTIRWPHAHLKPEALAKAGWYYSPHPNHADQVICFLCRKGLDGWEAGDDPLLEHIRHAPKCGWAILAAVEADCDDYAKENPQGAKMVEARKATFAGRWPHEGKKGWKCKTKQLVDAGWKYTPTADSDDMATCTYCQLALDGWEPADKPLNEHYNRSPDCPFFALTEEYQGPTKRGRKGARASKISRLSGQSVATVSEAASDLAADHEDSVMTTTSVATTASKRGRTKKATAAKGRRTRAKKDEVVESIEQDEEVTMPPPPPQKNGRGRKRGSDAIEDSVLGSREAPAPKKRATRKAANEDASMMDASTDTVLAEEPPKKTKGRKGRGSQAKTRKVSTASIASTASTASLRPGADQIPDDNEIDRQLAADLERPLTDDEDITADSRSERQTSKTKKAAQGSAQGDWAMFDPVPPVVDDADVEAELKALEAEQAQSQTQEDLNVPKKGRKAGTRKASKQKKAERKPVEVEAQLEPKRAPAAPGLEQLEPKTMSAVMDSLDEDELLKASVTSTATVVKANSPVQVEDVAEPAFEPSIEPTLPLPSKSEPQPEPEPNETKANPVKRGRGRPKRTSSTSARGSTANAGAAQTNKVRDVEVEAVSGGKSFVPESAAWPRREAAKSAAVAIPAEPSAGASVETISKPRCPAPALTVASPGSRSLVRPLPHPPSTPGRHVSPAASARQAALSPSQTPQSSDAENQPPSSKPPSSTAKRVALAPVEATPRTQSPSKRNRIAGLQTIMPWTAVDLDLIFESANSDKENGMRRQLSRGGDLTSPEKRMTVEEWIYYNAGRAEQRLKHECETVVNKFENEGSRAMRVLEGLIVE